MIVILVHTPKKEFMASAGTNKLIESRNRCNPDLMLCQALVRLVLDELNYFDAPNQVLSNATNRN